MDHNYLEFAHKLAKVHFSKPLMRFVASEKERAWAKQERAKLGADKLVMWVLRGSAVHKVWSRRRGQVESRRPASIVSWRA
jgi:hypothetical protein